MNMTLPPVACVTPAPVVHEEVEDPGRRGGAGSGRLRDGAYNAKEQQQHHHYVYQPAARRAGPRGPARR